MALRDTCYNVTHVEFPYGGVAAETLIKKGVLSNPLASTKAARPGGEGKGMSIVDGLPALCPRQHWLQTKTGDSPKID
jgi:hypothetical protein